MQPYRSRPETCAALARRLVTGALGVKLATARQEREHEKNILREAKGKYRFIWLYFLLGARKLLPSFLVLSFKF